MRDWLNNFLDLWLRYKKAFYETWAIRKQLEIQERMQDEREFLPAHLELIETPTSVAPKLVMRIIMAFAVIALLWAIIGQVEIVAVSTGKTIPSGHSKAIQPLETSVIKRIYVKDGDHVEKGDQLIELAGIGSDSDYQQARRQLDAAILAKLRNQALLQALDSRTMPDITLDAIKPYALVEVEVAAAKQLVRNQ